MNALEKLRRNSTLKSLAIITKARADELREQRGFDAMQPEKTQREHWNDIATIAYHLKRLAMP